MITMRAAMLMLLLLPVALDDTDTQSVVWMINVDREAAHAPRLIRDAAWTAVAHANNRKQAEIRPGVRVAGDALYGFAGEGELSDLKRAWRADPEWARAMRHPGMTHYGQAHSGRFHTILIWGRRR